MLPLSMPNLSEVRRVLEREFFEMIMPSPEGPSDAQGGKVGTGAQEPDGLRETPPEHIRSWYPSQMHKGISRDSVCFTQMPAGRASAQIPA